MGERALKGLDFWSTFSKKCLKTPFLVTFFKNLPAAQIFGQIRVFILVWESSENQFGRQKKVDKIPRS